MSDDRFSIDDIFTAPFEAATSLVTAPFGGIEGLFGDITGEEQMAAQAAENEANRAFIQQQAEQARGDIFNLFPAAEQARQQGTQAALDIFGQTVPQQLDVLQQGNVGAQQALTQGLPQILAALQGTPIDLSQIQPQTLSFDPGFAQQALPQFQSTSSLFPQTSPQASVDQYLAGLTGLLSGPVQVGPDPVGLSQIGAGPVSPGGTPIGLNINPFFS